MLRPATITVFINQRGRTANGWRRSDVSPRSPFKCRRRTFSGCLEANALREIGWATRLEPRAGYRSNPRPASNSRAARRSYDQTEGRHGQVTAAVPGVRLDRSLLGCLDRRALASVSALPRASLELAGKGLHDRVSLRISGHSSENRQT
jgi:hypothetical protein